MRRGFGLIGLLATIIFVVIVGVIAYNIGWSNGVNTHLPAAANDGTVAPYYGHYWGPGFGFFGIVWFLLILFGLFWLFRLAFWGFGARRFMGGGWYGRRGWGYGGPGQTFEERAQEWHRRQHGEPPPPPASTPPSTPPPPPTDTRSV